MKRAVLCVCMALAGCHAGYAYRYQGVQGAIAPGGYARSSAVDLKVSLPRDSVAGAILVGVLLADGMRYYLRLPDGTRMPYYGVPDADPARRINVQDCTQPIDLEAGNLMCR